MRELTAGEGEGGDTRRLEAVLLGLVEEGESACEWAVEALEARVRSHGLSFVTIEPADAAGRP